MASAEVLEFEKLLAPIPGDRPAGPNLREDPSPSSPYQSIKGARTRARSAERKLAEGDAGASPDWSPILEEAPAAIAGKSKDLELATWLTEALVRKHGFPGLRDGFRLLRGLVEGFWDGLQPPPDEDGVAGRVASVAALNGTDGGEGTLLGPIAGIPLTEEASDGGPYARWQYRQAADVEAIADPERRQKRIDGGAVTREKIVKAEGATSAGFARNLLEDIDGAIEEYRRLTAALEERCGADGDGKPLAPPSSALRAALGECREIVAAIAGDKAPPAGLPSSPGDPGASGAEGAGASRRSLPAGGAAAGRIGSREEAFEALLGVARFFKETEPHSPVSYALERIVRWGRMPLPELLRELIAEDGTRAGVFKLVGIPPPAEGS